MALQDSSDLSGLPEQPQPRGSLRGTIILWLVAISWVILLLPLYLVSTAVRGDITHLEANLQVAQEALSSTNVPDPEVQGLMNDLARVQGAIDEIEGAYSAMAAGHTNWPAVMAAIGNYNPSQLALTSIAQSGNRITLNGRAIDDSTVIAYSRALEESNLFSLVIVQSVRLLATPFISPTGTAVAPGTTVTPTATVTPTVTPTPIPDPTDQYEVDDFTPQPIFLGHPQLHNFYPVYDVDRVQFLAKAGRYYRVSTADLATGVDTFLTVILGGTTYTNDDREPGVQSSEITFRAGAGSDVEAVVKVTNRGHYGTDAWYQITVEEIIPTPTPTPTSTPLPTSTSMPSPTATPESTSVPTPDLRDEYEPDDTEPKLIDARGETQKHNFYPDNDVDRVEFLAKTGRWYRVSTSDLASGVDTVLTVSLSETTYINDDRQPRQPGDLSSEIVFQVETDDVDALVEVTNRRRYGPDKWYQITVEEIVPPTPTPTATPTPTPTLTPTSTMTSSSPSRLPGVASLASSAALADPLLSLQVMAERAGILPFSSTSKDGRASGVFSPNAVEFVIVLELKTESP